ncbi:MAG: cyanoexosortase A system-associated protein [Cyanomargarita calcarea GSE-NOS-MK-12-04C]|jgi:cyanosortase A-associated protein|uniref:Cyanoexosortase A system-associated protein n=1 Tax=Cyanomargarita calcarea GSE-NOS-MK-12-04C TaxID=2839659 RepID=A0A951QUF2_9CYAN|nr:cyanoexosortase A system-associated protein [Cyanomargarita calcarea GSE-NOS-MK-12-04C]
MNIWKQLRIPLLALTFGTVIFNLSKEIIFPSSDKYTFTAFIFPEKVPLPQWQFSSSNSGVKLPEKNPELIAQKHYQYIQNNVYLNIKMHYSTIYDVKKLIGNYISNSSPPTMRYRENIGFYSVGIHQQQAYLSACINPKGKSTFTDAQYKQNRYIYDLQPKRLMSWLVSQEPLFDKRCLWTHLSIPLNNSSEEVAYKTLENAWLSWYKYWQPRFPKS